MSETILLVSAFMLIEHLGSRTPKLFQGRL